MNRPLILNSTSAFPLFQKCGGGKAAHMHELTRLGLNVPKWICLTSYALVEIDSPKVQKFLREELDKAGLLDVYVAIRSSGIGEDSAECSFAGIHSSYLFQKGFEEIIASIKQCQASCFSERALEYRKQQGLSVDDVHTGVIIQEMVYSEVSGVAFSRDPVNVSGGGRVVINSVWGIGEGLVNGEVEGDLISVQRDSYAVDVTVAKKEEYFIQGDEGGLVKMALPEERQEISSLTEAEAKEVAKTVIQLEVHYGRPQDFEWAFSGGTLYCLQTRPVTTLPPSSYYEQLDGAILWDNSNIIESYSGVTTPLTFSFASFCYEEVYRQFCKIIAVPDKVYNAYEAVFPNMLGLLRGRIYYNLVNWYRLAILLPGAEKNQGFMETMMGVKQEMTEELAAKLGFPSKPPKSSLFSKAKLYAVSIWRFLTIDKIVGRFESNFNAIYSQAKERDFRKFSINELVAFYRNLTETILKKWQAPIINDCLCMIFFGVLKKLTENWVKTDDPSLQNDLLCGEGGIESAEPTKMLMKIAEKIDLGDAEFRKWFVNTDADEILDQLKQRSHEIDGLLQQFLSLYGFRCVNELKLEAQDLHDDPTFVIDAVASYVRMKTYSLKEMEKREQAIRTAAESRAFSSLKGVKKWVYRYVLKNARRAIRNRENMRFSRTKIFGIIRHVFRSMGYHFTQLGALEESNDIFYLTVEEIFSYVEGRSLNLSLKELALQRKREFTEFNNTAPPPDRMVTLGPVGFSASSLSLLSGYCFDKEPDEGDLPPNMLKGTPCSPGVVEGVVRVVRDLQEARGLKGEILVTERTDPGWVPLYPSCSGLLIERGSLLSHSAVVARELGLPTIVGIFGGLMQKLETGMKVRLDGTLGTVEILEETPLAVEDVASEESALHRV